MIIHKFHYYIPKHSQNTPSVLLWHSQQIIVVLKSKSFENLNMLVKVGLIVDNMGQFIVQVMNKMVCVKTRDERQKLNL